MAQFWSLKIKKPKGSLMPDPKLKAAMEEIKVILRNYDMWSMGKHS